MLSVEELIRTMITPIIRVGKIIQIFLEEKIKIKRIFKTNIGLGECAWLSTIGNNSSLVIGRVTWAIGDAEEEHDWSSSISRWCDK